MTEPAVEEYLDTHPNREQTRAAGLAAMREYEADYGPFTDAERAEAGAWVDRLFGPGDDESGSRDRSGA